VREEKIQKVTSENSAEALFSLNALSQGGRLSYVIMMCADQQIIMSNFPVSFNAINSNRLRCAEHSITPLTNKNLFITNLYKSHFHENQNSLWGKRRRLNIS
jgi:hypothetical protein